VLPRSWNFLPHSAHVWRAGSRSFTDFTPSDATHILTSSQTTRRSSGNVSSLSMHGKSVEVFGSIFTSTCTCSYCSGNGWFCASPLSHVTAHSLSYTCFGRRDSDPHWRKCFARSLLRKALITAPKSHSLHLNSQAAFHFAQILVKQNG
jgi:hypothetical protein